jgi:hypothetical protein
MRARTLCLIFCCLLGASPVAAQGLTGNELFADCTESSRSPKYWLCSGYVRGIAEARQGSTAGTWRYCPPEGATQEQLMDVVVKYLRESPASRHKPAVLLVSLALIDAWPCK